MDAEEASTDEKTAKIQWKSGFGAKTCRYSSKFKLLNSKFEFQASFCIANLKYHIYEASAKYGRRGGLHRRENSAKTVKTSENQWFGAKTGRYSSQKTFWI